MISTEEVDKMSGEFKGVYKAGAISFVISGILLLLIGALHFMLGPPPSNGTEILTWIASGTLNLDILVEVWFFAAVFLIPAIVALYYSLVRVAKMRAIIGCGLFAVVLPVICILDIVFGRLIYSVYYMVVNTPTVVEFIVALYYGGLHSIYLLLGGAAIVLGLGMKRVYGSTTAYLGIVAGVFYSIGSYPWIIGPVLWLFCQVVFAVWLLAVGVKLYTKKETIE